MNEKLRTVLCLVIAHAFAATVNFIFLLAPMQDSWLKLVFLVVTLLYLGVWGWYIAKGRKPIVGAVVFSLMLIVSVFGVVISHFSLLADWFIPVVILIWSPMGGLGALFSQDVLVWSTAAVISAVMLVFSIIKMKKLREQN